ncbi:LacI family DNA-binding transcriptional regulator [Paenisporosarcina antarctica]|uniref:LacI family transcriptional regulator n=1 Tax=Paenisporosarcina antarctica TaxID=417367 RepID=A0A4P7A1H4_9BACL|nr:LacI family DNA-binding transcriptional regulator [Paenisporosarcina antarctica]QBP42657.1 LacI family transcriptional regulator [Paenisporosarcina antarctica]
MKMDDIAKLASVSKSAVSLALSGKAGISKETREKILKIVKETGYIPRSMVKAEQVYRMNNSLRFLAIIDSTFVLEQYNKQPFFMELIHYIEEQSRLRGYSLLFSTIDISQFERDIRVLQKESEHNGIILLGTNLNKKQIEAVLAIQKNLVVLDNLVDELEVDFVVMNNIMGAYQACSYMVKQGHKHIGYVQSDFRMHNFESRKKGFEKAQNDLGFQLAEEDIFVLSPSILSAQEQFQKQIKERIKNNKALPTALFCENDYLAISVIKSLNELGLRVPEDISVVGFDNISESVIISPELTTVHVEKEMMATKAVEQVIRLINNTGNVRLKTIVDTRLTIRKSCKKV